MRISDWSSDVCSSDLTLQRSPRHDAFGGEDIADQAKVAVSVEVLPVEGDDAGRFLTPVLQGVQAERGQRGGILVAEHAEDPALVVALVVVARSLAIPRPLPSEGGRRRVGGEHCLGSPGAGSSEIRPPLAFSIS